MTKSKIKPIHQKKTSSKIFIIAMIAFPLLYFAFFYAFISIKTIIDTFFVPNIYGESIGFNPQFYKQIFTDLKLQNFNGVTLKVSFFNTFYAILINLIILPISIIIAYAFYKKCAGRNFFRVIFYLPSVISTVALVMAYEYLIGDNGPISNVIQSIFGPVDILSGQTGNNHFWGAVIFFSVFVGFGTNVVLLNGAMLRIPNEVIESARVDGMGFWRQLWNVVIPLIMPTITTWLIMITTSVFGFFLVPLLLGPATADYGWTSTIPMIIYNVTASQEASNIAYAQTLGLLFSLVILPISLIVRWVCEKFTPEVSY